MAKIVITRRGRIVGAEVLGRDAGELIAPFVLAVAQGMNIRHFATAVFPYPTRSEAFHRAAASHYARNVESPWLRRFVNLLLRKSG
jgi:pyruvate/2-oxoglutarate dehydrogenase complex dihydrolipoamide dehydrogenase (E3) component